MAGIRLPSIKNTIHTPAPVKLPPIGESISDDSLFYPRKGAQIRPTNPEKLPPIGESKSDDSLFYPRKRAQIRPTGKNPEKLPPIENPKIFSKRRVDFIPHHDDFNNSLLYVDDLEGNTQIVGKEGQIYLTKKSKIPEIKGGIKTRKAKRSKKTRKHKRRSSTYKKIHSRIR